MKNFILYFSALSMFCSHYVEAVNHSNQTNAHFSRSEASARLFAGINERQIFKAENAAELTTSSNVQIPSKIIAIDDHAFRDNADTVNVNTNYELKYIGEFAFANSSIESIKFNFELLKISRYAFAGCKNLSEMFIPDSIQRIGSNAFAGSKISSLSIPSKFLVYSEDRDDNIEIYIQPLDPHHGNWQTKIMTLAPGEKLTVITRMGGLNQDAVTTFSNTMSSDIED